jgi:type VII secretion protein EccB
VWTQRDQIQAYQFLRRRLVSALVAADANHPVSPSRRLILGTSIGVGVALLITAVFGVIGLLKPSGGKDWLSGGHVIVEEGTGARFVLGQDNALHPALNYASARLLAGGNGDGTVTVPAKNLATAPRGATVGIVGAPDSLPGGAGLVTTPWNSCSRTTQDAPSGAEPTLTVLLGAAATGRELARGEGVLVRLPTGERYLVSAGHRFRLSADASAALGYDQRVPVVVSGRWINTVPAGRDLGFIEVPDAGRAGPRIGGEPSKIGQVLVVRDSVTSPPTPAGYYLVRSDGVEVISQTEAALIMQTPENGDAYDGAPGEPLVVAAANIANVARAGDPGPGAGGADAADYPERIPAAVAVTGATVTVCAEGTGTGASRITVSGQVPLPNGAKSIPVVNRADARVADEVYVPPSGGAIVADRSGTGTVYLVTDLGMKYPVVNSQALTSLGYGATAKQPVSGGLLALVPTGPALDPVKAAGFAGPAGGAG